MKKLKGVFTVMITPFTSEGSIDENGFRGNIDWYIKEGIHGVICLGSTGEFATLSIEERRMVIDITMDQVSGRVPVIAGTAANATREVIEMTKYAQDAGAAAAIIVTPYYGLPTQEDLFEHYRAVAENVSIPIMLYNNPWYSGVDLLPPVVERLSEYESIQYIKESTGDIKRIHEIMRCCGDNIDIWCGWDDLVYESLMLGCRGWVAPIANFLPKKAVELFDLVDNKEFEKARALFFEMLPVLHYLEEGQITGKVKEAMNIIGLAGGVPRRPFLPISDEQKSELRGMLADMGLL